MNPTEIDFISWDFDAFIPEADLSWADDIEMFEFEPFEIELPTFEPFQYIPIQL